jgi:hypothetical protein
LLFQRLPFFTFITRNWTVLISNYTVRVKPFRYLLIPSYLRESFEAKKKGNYCQGGIWLKYLSGISSKLGPDGLKLSNITRNVQHVAALYVTCV